MDIEPLQRQVEALISSASATFESDPRVDVMGIQLPKLEHSPTRIALTGPFNAGKTMLIAAFLKLSQHDVDQLTAATPMTSGVTPYPWQRCVLLDLPGTLSGLEEHDAEAAAGVRQADLLLLITSVELPGEAETRQIDRLLSEEGFGHRCIVVVNKSNAEESESDVVRQEMAARLAAHPHVQVLFADARDYLDSLNFPDLDEDDRALLREDSGIVALEEALTLLVSRLGGVARLHAICHEVRRTSDEAVRLWEPDTKEESLELTVDRIRLAFANAHAELTDATDLALGCLHDDIAGTGAALAAAVSEVDGSVLDAAAATADERLAKVSHRYQDDASNAINAAVTHLLEQLGTTSDGWERYGATTRTGPIGATAPTRGPSRGKRDDVVDRLVDAGADRFKRKFDALLQGGVRPGSPAHDLARKLNGVFGRAPKPYVHIKMAEKLTKVGRGAGTAAAFIAPLSDLKGIVDNLRRGEEVKRHRERIRSAYSDHAQTVVREERQRLDAHIEETLAPIHEAVSETLAAADESSGARRTAQARLAEVNAQARQLGADIDRTLTASRGWSTS